MLLVESLKNKSDPDGEQISDEDKLAMEKNARFREEMEEVRHERMHGIQRSRVRSEPATYVTYPRDRNPVRPSIHPSIHRAPHAGEGEVQHKGALPAARRVQHHRRG